MSDSEAWTSIVIAAGETMQHGRNPREVGQTLCGLVDVSDQTLYRGSFYGTSETDCPACAELLPDNHY